MAGLGFFIAFISGGGPSQLAADTSRHLAGAGALAFGFAAYWAGLWMTHQKKGGPPVSDERDLLVVARANQATLIVVLLAIYVFTIGHWTGYQARGQVPIGSMWFLAHGRVFLASVTSAETLAERAGCPRQTIGALEQGGYVPSLALAFRIARVFAVGVEDVFEFELT